MKRDEIRNIAIIAHVDHGKTTLVDQLLRQAGTFRSNEQIQERVMDSNDLEKERGITILAKNTSITVKGCLINILDTPGHADFGGEVERILNMVDGVLLVVDAFEGCMPQTKFVLKKALERNLASILVVNKIDRENARPEQVVNEVYDLFIDLGANEEQISFPIIYASAINGAAGEDPSRLHDDMECLYDAIIEHIPAPQANVEDPLQMQISILDYDEYLGRIGIGRVHRGTIKKGQIVAHINRNGEIKKARIPKLFGFSGLKRVEIEEAKAGDLIAAAGLEELYVGDTIAHPEHPESLPLLKIDEPTLQMTFSVNNGPFSGKEGKHVTSRKLRDRLFKELEKDVSLRVEDATDGGDAFIVSGRGELHLSILIETMRREGYEFLVSKPEVIIREINQQKMEPYERVLIDVPEEYTGAIMDSLGERKAELTNMENNGFGSVRLEFVVTSRGLIGYQTEFLSITKGYGVLNHSFDEYRPLIPGTVGGRRAGALVSNETGIATTYGLLSVEDRGVMFASPGDEVYEGMIVGEHNRENDLVVNICKEKHVTNIRSSTKEETVKLKTPRKLSLEEALQYLNDDEFCEVTPKSIRLRKKILKKNERERAEKVAKLRARS